MTPTVASGASVTSRSEKEISPAKQVPLVQFVVIDSRWVAKVRGVTPADLDAWKTLPENARLRTPWFVHLLLQTPNHLTAKVDAAIQKRCLDLLRRMRGEATAGTAKSEREDFFALAALYSEDSGSAHRGAGYPDADVANFVAPVRDAYYRLAPGEFARAPIKSAFGWHIVGKHPSAPDAVVEADLRARTAGALARALADRIREQTRVGVFGQAAVDQAVEGLLGAPASAADDRPRAEFFHPQKYMRNACISMAQAGPEVAILPVDDTHLLVGAPVHDTNIDLSEVPNALPLFCQPDEDIDDGSSDPTEARP